VLASQVAVTTPVDRAAAFERLLDRGLDGHYRLAAVILGDPNEAEDAVHDAAVRAWHRFGSLREPERFDAWFGRILVNGCRDRLRARRRRPVIRVLPGLGDVDRGLAVADGTVPVEDRDTLARAFAALEPDQVVIIVLRFYKDLTVADIANRLQIPEGTVKSRLHHATRRLRLAIDGPGAVR
jgi:RNA polymerase sigma-70 factor (ECF subfamily)